MEDLKSVEEYEHCSSFTRMNYLLGRWRARKVAPHVGGKVLDAGCGIGLITDFLPSQVEYVGADLNPNHIRYLREKKPDVRAYCMDIQKELPEEEGPFDTIINLAVIEHLNDPESFLMNCQRLLKPGGRMVITTPTRLGERVRDILSIFGLLQRSKRGGKIQGHVNIFTLESIRDLMQECGFRVAESRYFQLGMNMLVVGIKVGPA